MKGQKVGGNWPNKPYLAFSKRKNMALEPQTEIEQYVQTYFGIGGRGLAQVAALFEPQSMVRNDFLFKTGQYAQSMSFLRTGYLRIYAEAATGDKDITQWIAPPGGFVTDLASFTFEQPARWNIQALTDCELFTIPQSKYKTIADIYPAWPALEKLFLAKCFITMENRIFDQLSLSAEGKYQQLFSANPEMFNQVPLQYIASMLGMTPETLSRVRKKMSGANG